MVETNKNTTTPKKGGNLSKTILLKRANKILGIENNNTKLIRKNKNDETLSIILQPTQPIHPPPPSPKNQKRRKKKRASSRNHNHPNGNRLSAEFVKNLKEEYLNLSNDDNLMASQKRKERVLLEKEVKRLNHDILVEEQKEQKLIKLNRTKLNSLRFEVQTHQKELSEMEVERRHFREQLKEERKEYEEEKRKNERNSKFLRTKKHEIERELSHFLPSSSSSSLGVFPQKMTENELKRIAAAKKNQQQKEAHLREQRTKRQQQLEHLERNQIPFLQNLKTNQNIVISSVHDESLLKKFTNLSVGRMDLFLKMEQFRHSHPTEFEIFELEMEFEEGQQEFTHRISELEGKVQANGASMRVLAGVRSKRLFDDFLLCRRADLGTLRVVYDFLLVQNDRLEEHEALRRSYVDSRFVLLNNKKSSIFYDARRNFFISIQQIRMCLRDYLEAVGVLFPFSSSSSFSSTFDGKLKSFLIVEEERKMKYFEDLKRQHAELDAQMEKWMKLNDEQQPSSSSSSSSTLFELENEILLFTHSVLLSIQKEEQEQEQEKEQEEEEERILREMTPFLQKQQLEQWQQQIQQIIKKKEILIQNAQKWDKQEKKFNVQKDIFEQFMKKYTQKEQNKRHKFEQKRQKRKKFLKKLKQKIEHENQKLAKQQQKRTWTKYQDSSTEKVVIEDVKVLDEREEFLRRESQNLRKEWKELRKEQKQSRQLFQELRKQIIEDEKIYQQMKQKSFVTFQELKQQIAAVTNQLTQLAQKIFISVQKTEKDHPHNPHEGGQGGPSGVAIVEDWMNRQKETFDQILKYEIQILQVKRALEEVEGSLSVVVRQREESEEKWRQLRVEREKESQRKREMRQKEEELTSQLRALEEEEVKNSKLFADYSVPSRKEIEGKRERIRLLNEKMAKRKSIIEAKKKQMETIIEKAKQNLTQKQNRKKKLRAHLNRSLRKIEKLGDSLGEKWISKMGPSSSSSSKRKKMKRKRETKTAKKKTKKETLKISNPYENDFEVIVKKPGS